MARLTEALGQSLRALPGVQAVGETSTLPLSPIGTEFRAFTIENGPTDVGPAEIAPPGLPPPPPPPLPPGGAPAIVPRFFQAVHAKVGPGFFNSMGIPLVAGRDFTTADRAGTLPVTIVNRAFAEQVLSRHRSHRATHSPVARDSLDNRGRYRRQHPAIRPRRRLSL